jgi:cytochrome c oxidase assembly protein subunit 15
MTSEEYSQSDRRLHRYTLFCVFCTFLLVIAGGLVTSTGSGLSVPDWPLSYGQVMPPMVGGIFYEHGHRMVATFVGMLTTGLAIWIGKVEKRVWVKWLGIAALGAVIIQGVLGGITVLFLLPTVISVMHATLAQSFLSLMIVIALVTSPGWRKLESKRTDLSRRTRTLAVLATSAVLMQLVLGGWMRHSDAGRAILDFPLSYGRLLPPTTPEALEDINGMRNDLGLAPVSVGQMWIHFAHRAGAVITFIAVSTFVLHILGRYTIEQRLREPAIVLGVLLAMQVLFGALTVWTGKGVEIATTHVAVGALLMGTSVFLTVVAFKLTGKDIAFSQSGKAELSRP